MSRVVLIGDAFVGKTALIKKYIERVTTPESYEATIGAAFQTYQTDVNNEQVTIQIWDTAGQEKFRALGPVYYRNSEAAVVVFDVTNAQTYENVDGWIKRFQEIVPADIPIFIVGNKVDLPHPNFDENQVIDYCEDHDYKYFSTSALTGVGVNSLFQSVADVVYKRGHQSIEAQQINKNTGSSCC